MIKKRIKMFGTPEESESFIGWLDTRDNVKITDAYEDDYQSFIVEYEVNKSEVN